MARFRIGEILLVSALTALLGAPSAFAHDEAQQLMAGEKLGTVSFPISCASDAQKQFNRAVSMLHSFWYEEAVKGFTAVTQTDPSCAMGYWGIAMSNWYPLWYPPDRVHLEAGRAAAEKARALDAPSERERAYIAAIDTFYRDSDARDHHTRSIAYRDAMEALHQRYPDDREATIFLALALDATAPDSDKSLANQRRAATLLEPIFAAEPDHPGVAHYLIHSYDSPALAEEGLPAARRYADIAPSVPHAVHMPGHIFTRLGLWAEDIASNRRSAEVAMRYAEATFGPGVVWDQALHAMDYLEYAYLQTGQDIAARRLRDEVAGFKKAAPATRAAAYAVAAIPVRYALERRAWTDAANLTTPTMEFPWDRFPQAVSMTVFARALGAVHIGDTAGAQREIEKLQSLRQTLLDRQDRYWAEQVEVQRLAAEGALAHAAGNADEALRLTRAAAELDATMEKSPVTPASVQPAREMLADLLLDLRRPEQALAEYERSLSMEPKRFRSLAGAARAAKLAGDKDRARVFYTQLAEICASADSTRPEIEEARVLAGK